MRMRTLRRLELALFGGLMLTIGALRLDGFLAYSAVSPDPRWARVAAERIGIISIVPFFFVLAFYGVYIPNTRLRSLLVVSAFATIPLVALALAAALNPPLRQFFPSIVAMNLVGVGSVGVLAVFNASRITPSKGRRTRPGAAQQVGPYNLKRQLGRGGMGEVYLAEHRLLKRPCAVKMIRPELSLDAGAVARFIREVEAVTKLTHLHTVRVYDYGQTDDGVFYTSWSISTVNDWTTGQERGAVGPSGGRSKCSARSAGLARLTPRGWSTATRSQATSSSDPRRRGGYGEVTRLRAGP